MSARRTLDTVLMEAIVVRETLDRMAAEGEVRLSAKAFIEQACRNAQCTPHDLNKFDEEIATGKYPLAAYACKRAQEDIARRLPQREPWTNVNYMVSEEARADLTLAGATPLTMFASASRFVTVRHPDAFGTASIEQLRKSEAEEVRLRNLIEELLAEMETAWSGRDVVMRPVSNDERDRGYTRLEFREHSGVFLTKGWPRNLLNAALDREREKVAA